ncbi:MAG TPA: acyltransferase [Bacteroidota bacterium]|nr:acyltransferase [Bacteroidota bacterium]
MFRQLINRLFQFLALYAPGAESLRVTLHRMRGVRIGNNVFIGTSAIIETEHPQLVSIGNNVTLGIRTVIVAHFRETTAEAVRTNTPTVVIEDDVFIGPGVIILQNVRIGKGAVVAAGSVVNADVPSATLVQGNPAKPVARCGVALTSKTTYAEFTKNLLPLR